MKGFFSSNRGFTLIELLVVIAIIGILSSVVIAALNTARTRSADTKVSSEMANIRTAAGIYYANKGNFGSTYGSGGGSGACPSNGAIADSAVMFRDSTSGMYNIITSLRTSPGVTVNACYVNATSWAVAVNLPSNPTTQYWCADSNGVSKAVTGTLTANTITSSLCP